MANVKYSKWLESLLADLLSGDVKAVLVDLADYTFSATHEFLTSVPAGARVATSANIASKTVTDGVFDGGDVTFNTVSGDPSEAVILYHDTGVEATSRLVAFIDTATGLPVTPNGGNINVQWDNGANRILAL